MIGDDEDDFNDDFEDEFQIKNHKDTPDRQHSENGDVNQQPLHTNGGVGGAFQSIAGSGN